MGSSGPGKKHFSIFRWNRHTGSAPFLGTLDLFPPNQLHPSVQWERALQAFYSSDGINLIYRHSKTEAEMNAKHKEVSSH